MDKVHKILTITSDKGLREVLSFCFDGWGYEVFLRDHAASDINSIKKLSPDVIVVDIHTATKANLDICRRLKEDFVTAFIPVITLIDKKQLRTQLLHLKQGVDDYLIKPPDPLDLRVRIEMAIRRAQYTFYASPLTGLPGGRVIEDALRERLRHGKPFSFGYIDIDNFKYFNDAYGYVKGDRAIMQTAYILYTTVRKHGTEDDFVGHIGGDDFVFITTPDKYPDICHHLITAFNKLMPFHYSLDDRRRGFIAARDRTHKVKNVPLMTISVSIVTRESENDFKNIVQINERIAEVKRYLKTFQGCSKYMNDRRDHHTGNEADSPHIYKIEDIQASSYRPMGQLLVEREIMTQEELDEALAVHWRRGIICGDVFDELGFIQKPDLEELLAQIRARKAQDSKAKEPDVSHL